MGQKIKGDNEALLIERWALTTVEDFYLKDPSNANVPLDVIGYSRGAAEAIKLVQDLSNGVVPLGKKQTVQGKDGAAPTNRAFDPKSIQLRFVGLISPVMGPSANDYTNKLVQQVQWTYGLPATIQNALQALDSQKYHQAGWNMINLI